MKKIATIIISALLVLCLVPSLWACNKDKGVDYTDLTVVYKENTSKSEFTGYETVINSIPNDWTIYAPSTTGTEYKNCDSGYIKSIDAFVLKKTVDSNTVLTLMKLGAQDVLFAESLMISAIRVKDGVIACKDINGDVFVCDTNGNIIINKGIISGLTTSTTIDTAISILTSELIAVNPNYDKNATSNKSYTCIYRVSTGKPVIRIKNVGATLSNLAGFENNYIVSTGTTENDTAVSRIFSIPSSSEQLVNYDGTEYGYYPDNGEEDYYCEITYMGNGKFFVHEDWTVDYEDETTAYTYKYAGDYYQVYRYIYDANTDSRKAYNSNYYFLNLTNKYYGTERTGISASSILKDGYYYATYCMSVENKVGYYDQFILDENLNIVYSLTDNFGVQLKDVDSLDNVSYYDLALSFVDGIGVVPLPSSGLKAIDKNGNVIFEDSTITVTAAAYNNGMIIAETLNSASNYIYAVYNMDGTRVADFKYSIIKPFLGYYTIAILNNSPVLLSKDGKVVEAMSDNTVPFEDIAKTSNNEYIYKLGCYMYYEVKTDPTTGDNVTYYGVKNFNANTAKNVILEANMVTGSLLYSSLTNPEDVFVFAKYAEEDTYTVYKLK